MFDPRLALEPFDLRSLLNLSQPLEAKQIGVLVSLYGREREERGVVYEITGSTDQEYVGEQYLVRTNNLQNGIVQIFLDHAEKLLKKLPSHVDTDTHYHEDMSARDEQDPTFAPAFRTMFFGNEPRNDLALDASGQSTPEVLRSTLKKLVEARYTGYQLQYV